MILGRRSAGGCLGCQLSLGFEAVDLMDWNTHPKEMGESEGEGFGLCSAIRLS